MLQLDWVGRFLGRAERRQPVRGVGSGFSKAMCLTYPNVLAGLWVRFSVGFLERGRRRLASSRSLSHSCKCKHGT